MLEPQVRDLQAIIVRRVKGMKHLWAPEWPLPPDPPLEGIELIHELHYERFFRFSQRQNQQIWLSGMTGFLRLEGDLKPWLPWLQAAEVLGLGKGVPFGLGQIKLDF